MNCAALDKMDELATHVLIYYVRRIASHIKFNIGYFATKGVTAYQIYATFWKAVSILELTCELQIIAAVSDGVPVNRKFYKMHGLIDDNMNLSTDVVYRTPNLFAADLFFLKMFLT